MTASPLFLGLDLSTQQLKAAITDDTDTILCERAVHLDKDLPEFGTVNGAIVGEGGEITCPTLLWVSALELLLSKFTEAGINLSEIVAISGSGQQHGSVYWSHRATTTLSTLDPSKGLKDQLEKEAVFSLDKSPIWQDYSTHEECRILEEVAGGKQALADLTGSRAYERYTGSQIMKIYRKRPEVYANTAYISLVSSMLASLFLCKIAPIEHGDASGMNLMNIVTRKWDDRLLRACGGEELRAKLAGEPVMGGTVLGVVGNYWVKRFGFDPNCIVAPFTGDNPASIVAVSTPGDAILSLGTSTTLLISIPPPQSATEPPPKATTTSHLLAHPTSPGGSIAMLCYKNGGLTRERVRDRFSAHDWALFNDLIEQRRVGNDGYMGFYFTLKEIIPDGVEGEHFFHNGNPIPLEEFPPEAHPRAVLESQLLSIRSRMLSILPPSLSLHRCIITGGASTNPTFQQTVADVLGLPVFIANGSGSGSAAVGGAGLARWTWWKREQERKSSDAVDDDDAPPHFLSGHHASGVLGELSNRRRESNGPSTLELLAGIDGIGLVDGEVQRRRRLSRSSSQGGGSGANTPRRGSGSASRRPSFGMSSIKPLAPLAPLAPIVRPGTPSNTGVVQGNGGTSFEDMRLVTGGVGLLGEKEVVGGLERVAIPDARADNIYAGLLEVYQKCEDEVVKRSKGGVV